MSGEKAVGLVPPRPNLGPEPWRDPSTDLRIAWASAILAAAVLLAAWWARRRRMARSLGAGPSAIGSAADEAGPRGRLLALAAGVRDALSARLGISFRARTTEELADDDRIAELLDEDAFRRLLQFLDLIDRIKFAPERSDDDRGEELGRALATWEPAIAAIAARVRSLPRDRRPPEAKPDRAQA